MLPPPQLLSVTDPTASAPSGDPTAQPLATQDGQPPVAPMGPPPDAKLQTYLVLNDEQDSAGRAYLRNRIDECRRLMGMGTNYQRSTFVGTSSFGLGLSTFSSGINSLPGSWSYKREVNQAYYDEDLEWRKQAFGPESIFHDSNHTYNLPSRFARLMAAKLDGDQLPSDQFFAAMPQSAVQQRETADALLAKAVEAYFQQIVGRSNLRDTMSEARLAALIRDDATIKLTWVRRATKYKGPATVLVNAVAVQTPQADGSVALQQVPGPQGITPDGRQLLPGGPIRLRSGEFIYQDDDTIPDPAGSGNDVLLKDPTFIMPPPGQAVFQSFDSLEQIDVDYEGLDAATVHPKDYLWWIESGTLEQSDIHCHVYDESLNDLRRKYGGFATFEQYDNQTATLDQSNASRPMGVQGEQEVPSSRHRKGIHETYLLFDADGDGEDEWVWWIYDYPNDKTIFVDYMKNHMKEPPFVMIPGLEKVTGRAYGNGCYTKLRGKSLFVDLQFNRINYKASKSATATFLHADAIQEVQDGGQFVLGGKEVWKINPDALSGKYGADRPPVFRVNLAETGEMEFELMQQMIQSAQLEIGQITSADASASDLDSSKTATGIINNERSGDALQNKTGDIHASRFKRLLEMALDIALENMPPAVAFYLPGGQQLAHLNREEIRGLDRDVRLLLTKARSSDAIQLNQAANTLVLQYLQLPPPTQKIVRSFFVNQLIALKVQDADDKLPDPTDADIASYQQQQAQQGKDQPVSVSVAAKLGDFLPSERSQIVQRDYQITPASPEEEQAAAIQNQQQQHEPVPAHHAKPPFPTPA